MKKLLCLTLILLPLLGCLAACNITQNASGAALEKLAESKPAAEQMLVALTQDNTSEAKSLMHPDAQNTDQGIAQMVSYLAGREVSKVAVQNVNVNSSTGTAGKVRQEQVSYKVTLSDNTVIFISAIHLSNKAGSGFISFQLVLGVV